MRTRRSCYQYGLTLADVSKAISAQHTNIPGGTLIASGFRFSIKVTGELTDPDRFNDLVVRSLNGKIIRVQGRGKGLHLPTHATGNRFRASTANRRSP
jgi:Cu/Ag efflux pump CusA